jgi:flagellar biosynthetic protein FliR
VNFLDPGFSALEQQLWHVLFLSVRSGAALLAAPILGGLAIPAPLRVLLSLALGLFVAIWVPQPPIPEMLSFSTLVAIAREAAIGAALGFVLQLAFVVPLVAAEQVAGTMGLAIATSIDPSSGAQSGAIGQYFSLLLTLLLFATGGYLLWFELLLESYRSFPAGQAGLSPEAGRALVLFTGKALAVAAAIALPVVVTLLLVQIVTGVLSRSAPALNLFALGLPAGVLAGLAALVIMIPIIVDQFAELIALTLDFAAGLPPLPSSPERVP